LEVLRLKVWLAAPNGGESERSSNCFFRSHDLYVIKPNLPELASEIFYFFIGIVRQFVNWRLSAFSSPVE